MTEDKSSVISNNNSLRDLQEKFQHFFKDPSLLEQALTHRSFKINLPKGTCDNERLEFLGDALMGAVFSNHLYQCFPDFSEGQLSKIRAHLVSRRTLAQVARRLNLGSYAFLGKGESESGGKFKTSILACLLEALIAAIYLDQGWGSAQEFLLKNFQDELAQSLEFSRRDYKSQLQELSQGHYGTIPRYRVLQKLGSQHAPLFEVQVEINGKFHGRGKGKSKKEAEQEAAKETLAELSLALQLVEVSGD
jgi:ribonuclease III